MQVEQPMPPGGENPYDFILAGAPKPKRSILPRGTSTKHRIILMSGLLVSVFLIFIVILSLVFSLGKSSTASLEAVAQTQTELLRVSTAGAQQVRDPSILAFTENVSLSTNSSQQATVQYLAKHGKKLNNKQLSIDQNAKTDQTLSSAQTAGNYDNVMLSILKQQLQDYQAQLVRAFKGTNVQSQKLLLQQLYNGVTALLKNPPQAVSS